MPESAPSRQSPTVFISYAQESDALGAASRRWPSSSAGMGAVSTPTIPIVDRPPAEGWHAWMLGRIEQAETTPTLKGRYEKTAAPEEPPGATYEGAIVTEGIYDALMRREPSPSSTSCATAEAKGVSARAPTPLGAHGRRPVESWSRAAWRRDGIAGPAMTRVVGLRNPAMSI